MESEPNQQDALKPDSTSRPAGALNEGEAFFQKSDWASFALTTGISLTIYILTLAPEVTLEMSGILSTAAMYGGVPHPPGFKRLLDLGVPRNRLHHTRPWVGPERV
jgi:hypothetical protein